MLLYSLLHLSGYDLPMEELKQFRQWEAKLRVTRNSDIQLVLMQQLDHWAKVLQWQWVWQWLKLNWVQHITKINSTLSTTTHMQSAAMAI